MIFLGDGRYTPPSQLPLAITFNVPGFLAIVSTASTCPSSAPMNGLAKIRSSLAAFTARVRSRALANGCMRGSRFREVGVGSPGRAGRCVEGACCSTEIFYTSYDYYNCIRVCTEDIPPFLFPLSKRAEKYFKRRGALLLVRFDKRYSGCYISALLDTLH